MEKTVSIQNNHTRNGYVDHTRFESLADKELISRILEGEIDLYEVILRRYNQKLYRIVRSYISEEEQIREVIHTAYIKAYEHLDQFRGDAKFSTWLVRITINEALTYLNKRERFNDTEISRLNENGDYSGLVDRDDPERQAVRTDMKRLLESAVESLPPKYRSVFIMREIEEMSTKETAGCLDITRTNVKVRLYRAKNLLRKELEKRVLDTDIFDFRGARCDSMVRGVMEDVFELITTTPELAVRG